MRRQLAAVLLGCACCTLPAHAQVPNQLNLGAVCSGDSISATLHVWDGGYGPELVGYDLYRRLLASCDPPVRLTEVPWSREPGQHFTRTYVDRGRPPGVAYEYAVVGVDANRQPVNLYSIYDPNGTWTTAYPSCGSAPIGHGTLLDMGWALLFTPCEGSCWIEAYMMDYYPPELRALADTGQAVLLVGAIGCGSIEGCEMAVESFTVLDCSVPVAPGRTWGEVKGFYR